MEERMRSEMYFFFCGASNNENIRINGQAGCQSTNK